MVATEAKLRELFAAAGCDGSVHVSDVDGSGEVSLLADEPVVAASVFKVSVALEFFRQVAAGGLDPHERVRLPPAARTPGPAGLSLFFDEVEVSLRDLAVSMLAVSDNAATDVLLARVGLDRVNELTRSLGLAQTRIVGDVRSMVDRLAADVGFPRWEDFAAHPWTEAGAESLEAALERMRASREADAAQATRTTAREAATLLRGIWRDEAGPPEACAQVRALMAVQLTRERIATGFTDPRVRVSAKSGSFAGAIRNEIGVVELPQGGGRYVVAIFTRAHELYARTHEINDAIGSAAALAVDALRAADGSASTIAAR